MEGGVHELPTIEETDKDNEDVNDFKFKPMDWIIILHIHLTYSSES